MQIVDYRFRGNIDDRNERVHQATRKFSQPSISARLEIYNHLEKQREKELPGIELMKNEDLQFT